MMEGFPFQGDGEGGLGHGHEGGDWAFLAAGRLDEGEGFVFVEELLDAVVARDAREDDLVDGERFGARDGEDERGRGVERDCDEVCLVLSQCEERGDQSGAGEDRHEEGKGVPRGRGVLGGGPLVGGGVGVGRVGRVVNGGVGAVAEFSGVCPLTYLGGDGGGKAGVGRRFGGSGKSVGHGERLGERE